MSTAEFMKELRTPRKVGEPLYRAVLENPNGTLSYNHGDGRSLVKDPWERLKIEPQAETTDLYRHFNAEGTLLYVGISASAMGRLSQHKGAQYKWTQDITKITVEKCASRGDALRAEKKAIKNESPLHNVQHNHEVVQP